ncbi:hypothetical protein F5Y12DRAFT_714322 [Xylaria sp. FL1777]|nr:hypothetical protein F5Y12DRAFT_714322 [Xylaria sp. FL1777]
MGKASKQLKIFIANIPDDKLKSFPSVAGTIYKDQNFRLDMQGLTTGKPQSYNLQIQVNKETSISTLKKVAPTTVAGPVLVPKDKTPGPDDIRKEFSDSMKL